MPSFHNLIFDLPPVGEVQNGLEPLAGKTRSANHSANLYFYVLPLHPMLSCVVSCTEHFFCKLRHNLVAVLLDEFLSESVHRLRG